MHINPHHTLTRIESAHTNRGTHPESDHSPLPVIAVAASVSAAVPGAAVTQSVGVGVLIGLLMLACISLAAWMI
ncbi:hypothetical protein [Rhodococcus sp. JVH1]|uniref:hypothetical protein n=1 Tax=Rhodococcus sp. JVH1 TaxID=745408 RepID=UPI0002720886|nr:hypothetical protein [Rhodococcus sp. JVH1]EJI98312.1 hypothetical protein JVH1_4180 [Rhodococcus sp. JVH1]